MSIGRRWSKDHLLFAYNGILLIIRVNYKSLVENSDYQLYYNTTEFRLEDEHIISMNAVGIILTILARKYQEFAFFDE